MARHTEGGDDVRRILRNLPGASRDELGDILDSGGRDIAGRMASRVINSGIRRRSGRLLGGITYRLNRQSLTVRIGIVGTPTERRRLFYARILDLGRKAQTVNVRRRKPAGGISRYAMRVRSYAAKHFVSGRYTDARQVINDKLSGAWGRILARIAGG